MPARVNHQHVPESSLSGNVPIDLRVVEGQWQTVKKKAHFQGKCYNCGKYNHMAKDCRIPYKNPKVQLNTATEDDIGSKNERIQCGLYAMLLLNLFPMVLHSQRLLPWCYYSVSWCIRIASNIMLIRDIERLSIIISTNVQIVLRCFDQKRRVRV